MRVLELAKKYYPRYWGPERIQALVDAGRMTPEEAAQVLGAVREKVEGGEADVH